jgi:outer membrane protein assembly factor BamE
MHRLALIIAALSLSACVYRVDIQQGNFVDTDRLAQLEVGMDERQVSFLLGDPVVRDTFNDQRWTYVYYLKRGHWDEDEAFVREIVVYFDDQGVVTSFEGAEYARELDETVEEYAEDEIGDARARADERAGDS